MTTKKRTVKTKEPQPLPVNQWSAVHECHKALTFAVRQSTDSLEATRRIEALALALEALRS